MSRFVSLPSSSSASKSIAAVSELTTFGIDRLVLVVVDEVAGDEVTVGLGVVMGIRTGVETTVVGGVTKMGLRWFFSLELLRLVTDSEVKVAVEALVAAAVVLGFHRSLALGSRNQGGTGRLVVAS